MTDPELHRRIDALAAQAGASVSVWAGPVGGGAWFAHREDVVHAAASTFKLPLVVAVLRAATAGLLSLVDEVPVHDDFDSAAPGERYTSSRDYDDDPLPWDRLGGTVPLGWLVERAIVRSSNLATNLLLEKVGTDVVRQVWDDAGATSSRVVRGIQDAPASAIGLTNDTTAADLARVVSALSAGRLLDAAATGQVRALLAAVEHRDAMPAGLPAGVRVEHKPGWLDDACHDVGLVVPGEGAPVVLSMMTTSTTGPRSEDELPRLVAEVTRTCWAERSRP